mmetsp:Transcript_26993/g.53848  ORF Transcript_26993/g.53848 Transcript_26993/m.53848 type:complete len:271 (-) Transcript_26993:85-897(-)
MYEPQSATSGKRSPSRSSSSLMASFWQCKIVLWTGLCSQARCGITTITLKVSPLRTALLILANSARPMPFKTSPSSLLFPGLILSSPLTSPSPALRTFSSSKSSPVVPKPATKYWFSIYISFSEFSISLSMQLYTLLSHFTPRLHLPLLRSTCATHLLQLLKASPLPLPSSAFLMIPWQLKCGPPEAFTTPSVYGMSGGIVLSVFIMSARWCNHLWMKCRETSETTSTPLMTTERSCHPILGCFVTSKLSVVHAFAPHKLGLKSPALGFQ